MIKKGYHYQIGCDSPKCQMSYVVGTARHGVEARRQAKQKLIKEGWVPGQVGTIECPECREKREKRNAEMIAKNMQENGGTPAENLQGVAL